MNRHVLVLLLLSLLSLAACDPGSSLAAPPDAGTDAGPPPVDAATGG